MVTLTAYGTLLAADASDRILTYRLLPYGEEGRTNRGRVTAGPGSVTVPDDVSQLVANLQHDPTFPVSRFVSVTESPDGLDASFRVLETSAGDDLLVEAAERVRAGISVELDDAVIRNGQLVSSVLAGAGHVTRSAFPSAQLVAADAGDVSDTNNQEDDDMPPEDQNTDVDELDDDETGDELEAGAAGSGRRRPARAPQGGAGRPGRRRDRGQPASAEEFFNSLAAAYAGGSPDKGLLAALDNAIAADITPAGAPNWLGEVWELRTHRQRYVPLYTPAPLNSLNGVGWKWAETTSGADAAGTLATPTVGDWAGFDGTLEVPSGEVKTEAVTWTASRLAGANNVDRAFQDFSTQYPDFWRGFYREAANDLSRKLDAAALANQLTAANYVTLTDPVTIVSSTDPADDFPDRFKVALSLIVAGVLAIQDRATPDHALVGSGLWRDMTMTEQQAALAYLSLALGLDPADGTFENFRIVPSSNATLTGKVMVGASETQTFYGPKTVRADTVDIAKGGIATGLYGYFKAFTADKYTHVLVSPTDGA